MPPILEFAESELENLAQDVINSQTTVTGVQPKLSLHIINKKDTVVKRFTIVGLWGGYILKLHQFIILNYQKWRI